MDERKKRLNKSHTKFWAEMGKNKFVAQNTANATDELFSQ